MENKIPKDAKVDVFIAYVCLNVYVDVWGNIYVSFSYYHAIHSYIHLCSRQPELSASRSESPVQSKLQNVV